MEKPLSKSQKLTSKFLKSQTLNLITTSYNNNINTKNNQKTSRTTNYEDNPKKSYSNFKSQKNKILIQKKPISINKKDTNKNNIKSSFDFSKFNQKNMEYDINKNLCKSTNYQGKSFLSRMELDIKNRQTKEEKRKNILEEYKPKAKEEERIKCFNRLISDANKRNKIKENIERRNEFLNCGISPKKISKREWDIIYDNRFYKYQEKIDNNLREKIIENEKIIKQKEEEIIEQINIKTKKVNKKDLDKIINRLYLDSKKKPIKKKLTNLLSPDKDKANGMKKDENSHINNNNNNNIDISSLSRGKKQHNTIKSTKIREKKNSYFGSVIIKTSTYQQGKTNSLIKLIQNIQKSDNKMEKRHTMDIIQKEIKEIENENLNISNLNSNLNSILDYNNNNNKIKKKKKDKFENFRRNTDIWANETHIKKSNSLKRVVLINDFNNPNNIKFNVSPNYKNQKIQKNKTINNGLNIIDCEYYKIIDEDNSELKLDDININKINDLKNNLNKKNKLNQKKHFNSPAYNNNYNINNIYNVNNNHNNNIYNLNNKKNNNIKISKSLNKNIKGNDNNLNNNNKRFIDELSAMKIVEDIFVNKIKK